jgi:hypothetical protein
MAIHALQHLAREPAPRHLTPARARSGTVSGVCFDRRQPLQLTLTARQNDRAYSQQAARPSQSRSARSGPLWRRMVAVCRLRAHGDVYRSMCLGTNSITLLIHHPLTSTALYLGRRCATPIHPSTTSHSRNAEIDEAGGEFNADYAHAQRCRDDIIHFVRECLDLPPYRSVDTAFRPILETSRDVWERLRGDMTLRKHTLRSAEQTLTKMHRRATQPRQRSADLFGNGGV